MQLLDLFDKNGKQLFDECVVYGQHPESKEYYHFNLGFTSWINNPNPLEVDMICCEYGYIHNVTQEMMNDFELIGSVKDNLHLFECD